MAQNESIKKPLKDWLVEFYEDTSKISEIVRNLAFAGIGLIWIFKNADLTNNILPKELISPLRFIVIALAADLLQYLWRSINIYILYRSTASKYDKKKLTDQDIDDVKAGNYIATGTWIIFGAKLILVVVAYYEIYSFLALRV